MNYSVTLLKMANLSCIHIPEEVFQSSEGYLEPSPACGIKRFKKIDDGFFLQKSSIVDVRLRSKYASRFVLYRMCVIRILAQPLKFSSEGVFFLVNI